ncbi:hypothetical protein [Streptomyces mesophilus]|uniref:hypothetical protein n=1 Tax=Streptomyces mesophilus TaxID=1775132 RepID=UPI00331E2DA0
MLHSLITIVARVRGALRRRAAKPYGTAELTRHDELLTRLEASSRAAEIDHRLRAWDR